MKKKIKASCKGFTLIEIIVAMVILGICSLLLVTMYSSVVARLRSNNDMNDRMSEQQKYVETKTQKSPNNNSVFDVKAYSRLASSATYTGADTSGNYQFEIYCTYNKANTSWVGADKSSSKNFVVNCAVYTLKNIEGGEPVATTDDNDDLKVDYKYFVGDNYMQTP